MTDIIKLDNKYTDIRSGDIVALKSICELSSQNDGKFIWNGFKLIELEIEYDDCGSVPKQFKILDFDLNIVGKSEENKIIATNNIIFEPKHWEKVIAHNKLVCFNLSKNCKDQLLNNFIYEYSGDKWVYYTYCNFENGKKLIIENDTTQNDPSSYEHNDNKQLNNNKLTSKCLKMLDKNSKKYFKNLGRNVYFNHGHGLADDDDGDNKFILSNDSRFKNNCYFLSYSLPDL